MMDFKLSEIGQLRIDNMIAERSDAFAKRMVEIFQEEMNRFENKLNVVRFAT